MVDSAHEQAAFEGETMDDVDSGDIPQTTGSRPDYRRRLKVDDRVESQARENDPELARQKASLASRQVGLTSSNPLNPLLIFIQMFIALMNGGRPNNSRSGETIDPPLSDFRDRYAPEDMENKQVFIAPRKTEQVRYAAELPTGLKGVTKEDSYLFITKDESDSETYRAYLVSKNDPGNRREIKVTGADLPDAGHKRLNVHLQGGHEFAVDLTGYRLDESEIRTIGQRDGIEHDQHIVDRLVKRRVTVGLADPSHMGYLSDNPVLGEFDGDRWTFWQKDIRSGRILKFTQSSKDPTKGTLEVIQGDAVSEAKENSMSPWTVGTQEEQHGRQKVYTLVRQGWVNNGETERAPISASNTPVSMPESMKEQSVFDTGNARANMALEKIIGDPAAVERRISDETHQWVVQQNGHNDAVRSQRQPSFPRP